MRYSWDHHPESEWPLLFLEGTIVPGDYQRLIEFSSTQRNFILLAQTPMIRIDTPGGDVEEAIAISRFIEMSSRPVAAGFFEDDVCASACLYLVVSASVRYFDRDRFLLHRPYINPIRLKEMTPVQARARQREVLRITEDFLRDRDVPSSVIETIARTASVDAAKMTYRQSQELGRVAGWWEEYLIANCGLDRRELLAYKRFEESGSVAFAEANKCGVQLGIPVGLDWLEEEYSRLGVERDWGKSDN
ncbi:MAG: hypothetical protein JJ976_17755 [Rhodothermales bacterium]|nr:hypothetical protein [Rhodothermales bacterium]